MIQFLLSLFLAAVPADTDWTIVQVNDARYWSYASDALPEKLKNDVHICGPDATVYATLKAPTREQVHEAIKKAKSQKRSPDALDEVNALRARHGLPAFIRDDGLTQAAKACAQYRAANLMAGHTSNDFAYLPLGGCGRVCGVASGDGLGLVLRWRAYVGWRSAYRWCGMGNGSGQPSVHAVVCEAITVKHLIDRLRMVAGEYWQPADLVAAVTWAVQAIEEQTQEIYRRAGEIESLKVLVRSQAERIAAQSDLLSKKAEAVHGQQMA